MPIVMCGMWAGRQMRTRMPELGRDDDDDDDAVETSNGKVEIYLILKTLPYAVRFFYTVFEK